MRDADGTSVEEVDDDVAPVAAVGDELVMVGWSVALLLLPVEKKLARLSKPAFIDAVIDAVIVAAIVAMASLRSSAEIADAVGTPSLVGRLDAV